MIVTHGDPNSNLNSSLIGFDFRYLNTHLPGSRVLEAAAEAFILSQRGEGWEALPDRFDDGGFTGGNMDRPALKRLLAAVESRLVDCVVVYKVDRLSRSLLDFAKIMELFDRHGISFVSVTQQFNTTSSPGRLTLNILLSFAQFEREIISERTRDKMRAARKKGKWISGHLLLGYDIDSRGGKLMINPEEARQVQGIFELYLKHGALLTVLQELERRGWHMKRWTTQDGVTRGGRPFTKGTLHRLLTNAVFTGKIEYQGTLYAGEHEAIIEQAVWDQVQKVLRRNRQSNSTSTRNKYGALLRGLLFCLPCGTAMTHSYTARHSKRYRYYVCYRAQQKGWKHCETKSISAPDIQEFLLTQSMDGVDVTESRRRPLTGVLDWKEQRVLFRESVDVLLQGAPLNGN